MKEYIIYGAGLWGRKLLTAIESLGNSVVAYCDSNIGRQMINGCEILSFEQFKDALEQKKSLTVVVAIKNTESRISVINKINSEIGSWVDFESADDIFNQYFEAQLKKCYGQLTFKWNVRLDNYMDNWCDNLMNEVESWVLTAVNLNNPLHWKYDSYRRNKFLNIEEKRRLPIELHDGSIVMDIGCGLFCKYGNELPNGERVTLIPVDALAYFYNSINAKKNDENRKDYKCYFGLFEFMANSWESEFADIIIIGNALDHCIDPFRSIIECLHVLKTNGVMRLIHARAEGIYENWEGLHRWNIDTINGEVVIWNRENAVNISNELKEVAQMEITTYWEEEDTFKREYIIVDIIKKKDIEIETWVDTKNDSKYIMYLAEKIMNNWANDSVELKTCLGKIRIN